jgi:hypothetical protein
MLSTLAWPRSLLLLALAYAALLFNVVHATVDSLCEWPFPTSLSSTADPNPVTSSITYCAPPQAILIQEFSVIYFAANQSVSFNISAASVVGLSRLGNN